MTNLSRAVVFVESNTSGTGLLFIIRARDLGYVPYLIAAQPRKYNFEAVPELRVIAADTTNTNAVSQVCKEIDVITPIAGIWSSSEHFVAIAASVAAIRHLPCPDPASVNRCRNKWLQRLRLEEAVLQKHRYTLATSTEEACQFARQIGMPVVVKPIDGSGSINVRRCDSIEQVALHATTLEQSTGGTAGFLVEEFVEGIEYSVELFDGKPVGLVRKHLGAPPSFVEIGHDMVGGIGDLEYQPIFAWATRVANALEMSWGPVHLEFRQNQLGLHVMEMNPRLAGGFIPELIRHSLDLDLIRATLLRAVGHQPSTQTRKVGAAALRFLISPRDGVLTKVTGIDRAAEEAGVVAVQIYRNPGDRLAVMGDFRDRIGHVLAMGRDAMEAGINAERALGQLGIVFNTTDSDGGKHEDAGYHGQRRAI